MRYLYSRKIRIFCFFYCSGQKSRQNRYP